MVPYGGYGWLNRILVPNPWWKKESDMIACEAEHIVHFAAESGKGLQFVSYSCWRAYCYKHMKLSPSTHPIVHFSWKCRCYEWQKYNYNTRIINIQVKRWRHSSTVCKFSAETAMKVLTCKMDLDSLGIQLRPPLSEIKSVLLPNKQNTRKKIK